MKKKNGPRMVKREDFNELKADMNMLGSGQERIDVQVKGMVDAIEMQNLVHAGTRLIMQLHSIGPTHAKVKLDEMMSNIGTGLNEWMTT